MLSDPGAPPRLAWNRVRWWAASAGTDPFANALAACARRPGAIGAASARFTES
jgi:hypothetical protein